MLRLIISCECSKIHSLTFDVLYSLICSVFGSRAKRFIPSSHECLQILHHSFVYGLSMVLLVIGDIKSTILRANLV